MVLISLLFSLCVYALGTLILSGLGLLYALFYIAYCLFIEFNLMRRSCVNCYYYGKRCVAGKGLVAGKLFRKGDPKKFCEKKVTWKNLLPHMAVTVVPLVGGAYLLWTSFEWLIAGVMAVPVILWFLGNPLVYGKLACPHCRQGRICCPANDFFGKKVEK